MNEHFIDHLLLWDMISTSKRGNTLGGSGFWVELPRGLKGDGSRSRNVLDEDPLLSPLFPCLFDFFSNFPELLTLEITDLFFWN